MITSILKIKEMNLLLKTNLVKKIIDEIELYDSSHDEQANKDLNKESLYVKKLKDIELDEDEF